MFKSFSTITCFKFLVNLRLAKASSFGTYMNPVLPRDPPDCTLTKIGTDFYTTGSFPHYVTIK